LSIGGALYDAILKCKFLAFVGFPEKIGVFGIPE